MEIEGGQSKQYDNGEMKDFKQQSTKQQQDSTVIRKDNLITTYKGLMTFVVKQFCFECIPIGQCKQIYSNDPATTLKNQIKYYSQLVMKNFEKHLLITNEMEAFQFFIESSTLSQKLREYTEELVDPILNLKNSDFTQAFEKEFSIKKGKPLYFDPDFNGSIRQGFSEGKITIQVQWQTYKDKLYPLGIISQMRKFMRMVLKVQSLFNLMYYQDQRKIFFKIHVEFQYSKNQLINEVCDLRLNRDNMNLIIQFSKLNAIKQETNML